MYKGNINLGIFVVKKKLTGRFGKKPKNINKT